MISRLETKRRHSPFKYSKENAPFVMLLIDGRSSLAFVEMSEPLARLVIALMLVVSNVYLY